MKLRVEGWHDNCFFTVVEIKWEQDEVIAIN